MLKFTEELLDEMQLVDSLIEIDKVYREEQISVPSIKRMLNRLTKKAVEYIETDDEYLSVELLMTFFYTVEGFKGPILKQENFDDFYYFDKVLKTKVGCDLILAVIFSHLASHININASPIYYFGQVLLRIEFSDGKRHFFNAETGEEISLRDLKLYVKNYGSFAPFSPGLLEPQSNCASIMLLAAMRKNCYYAMDKLDEALNMSNFILTVFPEQAQERRERGLILAKLGCPHVAVPDLQYFVENCPDDPMSEITKVQISAIMPEPIPIH